MLAVLCSVVCKMLRPSSFIAAIILLGVLPSVALADDYSTTSHLGDLCFAVADERTLAGGAEDSQDTLVHLNVVDGTTDVIGLTGTTSVEAMTFGPSLQLFVANGRQLGTLNIANGQFSSSSQPFGTAGGIAGEVELTDVDGLAYSLSRNILFGVHRRGSGMPDLLFAIDPATGAHIPDYFGPPAGPKTDYVVVPIVVDESGNNLSDVDDIQINPVTGILYGAINTGGRGGVLATIDIDTGAAARIATFRFPDGEVIDDIEGISFSNDGSLYASTGDNFGGDPDDLNRLFNIIPATGLGTPVGLFPAGPKDYEAVACFTDEASIVLHKLTNGPGQEPDDADTPTGPLIEVGEQVTWTYVFTNTGVLSLTELSLVDDQIGAIGPSATCLPAGTVLGPGESLTCTATGIAQPGQYSNVATITGNSQPTPFFPTQTVSDTNPSHYFGGSVQPPSGINIKKYTNGEDADLPPGPIVPVGSTVTWTYLVSNTSTVPLSNVTVTDNIAGVTPVFVSGDTDGDTQLDIGETWLFQATGTALAGQYANIGTVQGTPPTGPNLTDTDPSHYFGSVAGEVPGIQIEKFTNGEDADTPTGPIVLVGSTVTWTYEVRNTGNEVLSSVTVLDNIAGVTPVFIGGDTDGDSQLDLTEVWFYRTTGIAIEGQYANVGTVTGTPPTGPDVSDTDPSHYFGSLSGESPGINIKKFTNGQDADTPTGPTLEVGSVVTWTYEVRNTGGVPLSNVTVTDNVPGVTPVYISGDTNNNSLLDLTEVWLFRATGIAVLGQYANTGTATGTPPTGPNVTDSDPSHYFGVGTEQTNLPTDGQPQADRSMFLPSVQAD